GVACWKTVDKFHAKGAFSTSCSARGVGDANWEVEDFDEQFMKKVACRRAERLEAASDWINIMIQSPTSPQVPQLFSAMVNNQKLADEFTENFNYPIRQITLLGSEDRVEAAVERTSQHTTVPAP